MHVDEACLVLGLSEEFTIDEINQAYNTLWRNTELNIFAKNQATSDAVNNKLRRLNQARAALIDFVEPDQIR